MRADKNERGELKIRVSLLKWYLEHTFFNLYKDREQKNGNKTIFEDNQMDITYTMTSQKEDEEKVKKLKRKRDNNTKHEIFVYRGNSKIPFGI